VWERQETLARYLEEVALKDAEIIRFQERAMTGRLLSEEEALAILSSPILADQPLSTLTSNGISLLENSHLLEEEADAKGPYRKLVIKGWRPWKVRPLAAKGPELVYPADFIKFQNLPGLRAARAITFHHPREEDQVVIAREGSFIAQLVRLAEDRLRGYPISVDMGVWFILTGEFISQDPVRLRYVRYRHPEFSRTTFTLEVEGWVPPEEVLEQYRHAQHEVLGGTPRSLKRRTVALFGFVHRYKGKSWRELFDAWNKAHRDQRFRDRSHLFTTYMRAREYIAGAKPTKDEEGERPKIAGTDPHGFPIFAGKWYLLHSNGNGEEPPSYTGSFDSCEEAQDDPRSENSEVLTAKQLVARLAVERRCLELSDDLNTYLKATNEQDPEEAMRQYYDGRLRGRVDGLRMSLQQYGQWKPRDDVKQKLEYPETPDDLWSVYSYIRNIGVGWSKFTTLENRQSSSRKAGPHQEER
jgi:hypothetical protein